ncbi:hypothetical protein D3C76_1026150 [compost metagenome]
MIALKKVWSTDAPASSFVSEPMNAGTPRAIGGIEAANCKKRSTSCLPFNLGIHRAVTTCSLVRLRDPVVISGAVPGEIRPRSISSSAKCATLTQ